MKKIVYLTGLLMLLLASCTKPDNEVSLLEPEFQRCYFSREYVNGVLYREAFYVDEIDYRIDYVQYYQNGILRPEWTEYYEYEGKKLVKRYDSQTSWIYTYNNSGAIQSISECTANGVNCCVKNYEYNYNIHNLPVTITINCPNSAPVTEIYDYTNTGTRSYYYYRYQNNVANRVVTYQTNTGSIINPLERIDPTGINNYQMWTINDLTAQRFWEYEVDINTLKGIYPVSVTEYQYNSVTFMLLSTRSYTYEYIGCYD